MYFQNDQFYSTIVNSMHRALTKDNEIDGALSGVWTSETVVYHSALQTPFRFLKSDNIQLSKSGTFLYKVCSRLMILPVFALVLIFFPITAYFLYSSESNTIMSNLFLVSGWFILAISIFMAFLPNIRFKNTHTINLSLIHI